jgi:hypothetical protein
MTALIFPVTCALLLFAGTPISCLQCESEDAAELTEEKDGNMYKLTCNTRLEASFARWEINDNVYQNRLPPGYRANGFDIEFELYDGVLDFRCFFLLASGGVACSNPHQVAPGGTDEYYILRECPQPRLTILNLKNVSTMYMGFDETATRNLIVNLTKCDDKGCTIRNCTVNRATEVVMDVTPVGVFYERNTELLVSDSSYGCEEVKIYIPCNTMEPTENITISSNTATIVENLTSTFCTFGEVVEHRICVHTNETKCYENDTAPVFVNTTNEPPSLEIRGIKSGTAIISLFCKVKTDCVGINDVMAFNYKIYVNGAAGTTVLCWITAVLIVLSGVLLNSE